MKKNAKRVGQFVVGLVVALIVVLGVAGGFSVPKAHATCTNPDWQWGGVECQPTPTPR